MATGNATMGVAFPIAICWRNFTVRPPVWKDKETAGKGLRHFLHRSGSLLAHVTFLGLSPLIPLWALPQRQIDSFYNSFLAIETCRLYTSHVCRIHCPPD